MKYKKLYQRALIACLVLGVCTIVLTGTVLYYALWSDSFVASCTNVSDPQTAHNASKSYLEDQVLNTTGVKALRVDRADYDAMTCILDKDPKTYAFRIYFGKNQAGAIAKYIVAVESSGRDNVNLVYQTSAVDHGLCPLVCDINSPIYVP